MIRRAITAARTVLAIARDAALDLRDEARTIGADRFEYEECPGAPSPAEAALAAARDRQARAAFAAGYAAACTGGMSAADQRRLRERMARWLEDQRG